MSDKQAADRAVPAVRPAVDVYETTQGITLYADMPGVTRDQLQVHVEDNVLQIEGGVAADAGGTVVHEELRAPVYRRSFTLGSELQTEGINASLKDGVLTVTIPRRAAPQPRRIEVQVA